MKERRKIFPFSWSKKSQIGFLSNGNILKHNFEGFSDSGLKIFLLYTLKKHFHS